MKKFFEAFAALSAGFALTISIGKIYLFDPYTEIAPHLFIFAIILAITSLVVLFLRYRQPLEKVVVGINSVAGNKRVLLLVALFGVQLLIASVCYSIYYNHQKLYVLGDEIEKRHQEILKEKKKGEYLSIKEFNDEVDKNLKFLSYVIKNQPSFAKSSDGNLLMNDSICIVLEYPLTPPSTPKNLSMLIYSKKELKRLTEINLEGGELTVSIQKEISDLNRRASLIRDDLNKIEASSADLRWSYLQFLSYFFREQLQAMSTPLMLMDALKYLVWLAITIWLSTPLWKKS